MMFRRSGLWCLVSAAALVSVACSSSKPGDDNQDIASGGSAGAGEGSGGRGTGGNGQSTGAGGQGMGGNGQSTGAGGQGMGGNGQSTGAGGISSGGASGSGGTTGEGGAGGENGTGGSNDGDPTDPPLSYCEEFDSPPGSCSALRALCPKGQPNGVYTIDPDGAGPLPPMSAYCENQTSGGGWTLVLSYLHQGGSNPELLVRTEDLPLRGSDSLGGDESASATWGHAASPLIDALNADELWFHGRTALHPRVINFTTRHDGCVTYARSGTGSCSGVEASFVPLPSHSAQLPAAATSFWSNQGDDSLVMFPFYLSNAYHWAVRGGDVRWEADDWAGGSGHHTLHRIYVRSQAAYFKNCRDILAENPGAPSGTYVIDPFGSGLLMDAYCDQETDGGGWTMILNYLHKGGTNPGTLARDTALPLLGASAVGHDESDSYHWGHATLGLVTALSPAELRFFGKTSSHERTLHFKTDHAACLAYVQTGTGSCNGIEESFTALGDHSAHLPGAATHFFGDQGNNALLHFPFYADSLYHWGVRGGGLRWEVDDWVGSVEDTLHRVFVR